jgi:hypothetical protein
VRARDGDERNLRPENLILIERGPRPFTNSQVRRASSRHTTPTPAAISLGRIALPQLACRGDRLAEIRPGQSVQERDNGLRLVVGQRSVKLRITHRLDRLRQGGRASVVKIRRRDRDVPQAWDTKDFGLGRGKWVKYSVPLVHVATHIDALMARDAAERLEQLVAGELLGGYRVDVAAEPSIKSASRREEGPLVGCDGADESRAVDLLP